jgi:hypothetical protein
MGRSTSVCHASYLAGLRKSKSELDAMISASRLAIKRSRETLALADAALQGDGKRIRAEDYAE